MASIAHHTYNMLSRHNTNSAPLDFSLYPDPSNSLYPPQALPFTYNSMQQFADPNAPYLYHNQAAPLYADASAQFDSAELRGAASNHSTGSAASSAMNSPRSMHDNPFPVPEWNVDGPNPSIAGFDSFAQGTEYNFVPGMDEFTLDLSEGKPDGFVGECQAFLSSALPVSSI